VLSIASHQFIVDYTLAPGVAVDDEEDDLFSQSLMEKAGISRARSKRK
jgi:hypothetical protein